MVYNNGWVPKITTVDGTVFNPHYEAAGVGPPAWIEEKTIYAGACSDCNQTFKTIHKKIKSEICPYCGGSNVE